MCDLHLVMGLQCDTQDLAYKLCGWPGISRDAQTKEGWFRKLRQISCIEVVVGLKVHVKLAPYPSSLFNTTRRIQLSLLRPQNVSHRELLISGCQWLPSRSHRDSPSPVMPRMAIEAKKMF
jgi:hypothetical protein